MRKNSQVETGENHVCLPFQREAEQESGGIQARVQTPSPSLIQQGGSGGQLIPQSLSYLQGMEMAFFTQH